MPVSNRQPQASSSTPLVLSSNAPGTSPINDAGPIKISANQPFKDGGVEIELQVTGGGSKSQRPREEVLFIKTGDGADKVDVRRSADGGVSVNINGKTYDIPISSDGGPGKKILIQTQEGADTVVVAHNVKLQTRVDLGNGNNTFCAGSGSTQVLSGTGDDNIQLGSGVGYVEDHGGNNQFKAGSGYSVMYGLGQGNNDFQAGDGGSYMLGAGDRNRFRGGSGHNTMVALRGESVLEGGSGQNVFYTGKSQATVTSKNDVDITYGKKEDHITRTEKSKYVEVKPSDAGRKGFVIEGTPQFKARVEAELEMLRGSPVGQQMLEQMDKAAAPVTIVEGDKGDFYQYRRPELAFESPESRDRQDAAHGYLTNKKPGLPAENSVLTYDRAFTQEDYKRPPINSLFHEMAHAYNGANGTSIPGETYVGPHPSDPDRPHYEDNSERQAVGLPTDGEPYDFDGDPTTPPTSTNPSPFNENALYKEMGKPLRTRYFDLDKR
ncbi:M91 family zinc metallopeptidase [Pseudomonas sp. HN11]|uniref:type III secretion system effector protein n=1 Tax=Pseudomonas sp. HN11 TaxID=1344094 RepID=UPI001F22088F|nr:M91 family zinc metallopeptidase [Pseudomonas sp. HN11]UII74319.1 M91 family zinc metallopeptidase [Pseudomonas sp. HN11]